MRFIAGNAQHIGARHSQQDSFGFSDPDDTPFVEHGGFLAILCDGMGGMEYGDAASRTAVRAFLDAYQRKSADESIPAALERSVHEANQQVVALATRLGLVEGIGTTLIATTLHQHSMYFISVGDSGIFQASAGDLRMINRPHVFANVLDAAVARGNMSPEDAANHPERESLTSYIGAQKLEEIDRNLDPIPVGDEDVVLLASDGLFKTLHLEEMRACCSGPPQSWPEKMVERTMAKQREYQDNVTVLSVALESARTLSLPATAPPKHVEQTEPFELPKTVRMAPEGAPQPVARAMTPSLPEPPAALAWTPPVQAAPLPPPPRGRTGFLIPLIVLLLLAAAGAGWWYWREHRAGLHPSTAPDGAVQAPTGKPVSPPPPDPKDVQPAPKKEPQ